MTIPERVAHLANMILVIEYHEKLGNKSKWMVFEWEHHNAQLAYSLKETYDEAGNRKDDSRTKAGTDFTRNHPSLRGANRTPDNEH